MDKLQDVEHYQKVFKIVRRVLNYVDPETLEPGKPEGAPADEYEMEAAPIAAFVIRHLKTLATDPGPLTLEIDRTWREYFDRDCPGADTIAIEILREISRS